MLSVLLIPAFIPMFSTVSLTKEINETCDVVLLHFSITLVLVTV